MTHRKTRDALEAVAEGLGTAYQPPAARSSMMKVAGRTDDEMEPGEELLADDGEAMGPTEGDGSTMAGPVYPEGVVRCRLGELRSALRRIARA